MDEGEIAVPKIVTPRKSEDLEVILQIRSSKESLGTLNHLSDQVIRSVLSMFELVLVEKEEKVNLQANKHLRVIKIVLQDSQSTSEVS